MSATKLYLPYGTLSSVADARYFTFHWFHASRETPVAPYASLILGYSQLSGEAKTRAEAVVDEFLSEDEFHLLRDYLRERYHEDLRTAVLVAPVNTLKPDAGSRAGTLRPFSRRTDGDGVSGSGFCRLPEDPRYSLPFAVWGYYAALPAHDHLPLPRGLTTSPPTVKEIVPAAAVAVTTAVEGSL